MKGMLYSNDIAINDKIKIHVPTIKEILDNASEYYSEVSVFTSVPIDLMVQLDDAGIDFREVSEYDLFCSLFVQLMDKEESILLKGFNISTLSVEKNEDNGDVYFYDKENDSVLDKGIYFLIADVVRKINGLKKNTKKPANDDAMKYMIERARKKQKRALRKKKNRGETADMENLIISLVNTAEFKYNYETVLDLTIYQFNSSLNQIIKKIRFDNLMVGCYSGFGMDTSSIKKEDLSWIKDN